MAEKTVDVKQLAEQVLGIMKQNELNPSKLGQDILYEKFLAIKNTMAMSTEGQCLGANEVVSSLLQAVTLKAALCHYWEHLLADSLDHLSLETKARLHGDAKLTKEELSDAVQLDPEVVKLAQAYSSCKASRFFWEKLSEMFKLVGERVDSNGKSLGLTRKLSAPPMR